MKVLAAVVTHNRSNLLARCLDGIQAQSRAADHVLVVNNASTDGTVEMLTVRGVDTITQENTGSAGGWKRCIEYAASNNFDAIWLMDDDGYPDDQALSLLLAKLDVDVSCASSAVLQETDRERFVFPFPKLSQNGLPLLLGWSRKIESLESLESYTDDGVYPFAHLFNGALVSMQAVNSIGNVNSDYFMFGDEVDYFFRLKAVGRVITVLNAFHFHPDVSQRPYSEAKVYYYLKNTIILNRKYFDWVWLRHIFAIAIVLLRTWKRNGPKMTLSLVGGRMGSSFYKAIWRGLHRGPSRDFNE